MTIDGVSAMDRLIAGDCLAWILQREPAKRPQSCAEVLAHPLFSHRSVRRRASVKQLLGHFGHYSMRGNAWAEAPPEL